MTTIVTVHGTGADAREDSGGHWSQKHSEFQDDIDRLIEGSDGPIEWVPFHWDGANSEKSRRNEGRNLLKFLHKTYEKQGKPYHLLGHSHGGSVIAEALRQSTYHRKPLKQLQSWTTVAAPFLEHKKNTFFFNRLSLPLQLILALLVVYFLQAFVAVGSYCYAPGKNVNGCWISFGTTPSRESFDVEDIEKIEMLSTMNDLVRLGDIKTTEGGFEFSPFPFLNEGSDNWDFVEGSFQFTNDNDNRAILSKSPQSDKNANEVFLDNFLIYDADIDLCIADLNRLKINTVLKDSIEIYCEVYADSNLEYDLYLEGDRSVERLLYSGNDAYFYEDGTRPNLSYLIHLKDSDNILVSSVFSTVQTYESPLLTMHFDRHLTVTKRERILSSSVFLFFVLLPMIPLLIFLLLSQRKITRRFSGGRRRQFDGLYAGNWINIVDRDDEALNALSNVVFLKSKIAPKNLLSGFFKVGFVTVLLITFFLYNDQLYIRMEDAIFLLSSYNENIYISLENALATLMPDDPDRTFSRLISSTTYLFFGDQQYNTTDIADDIFTMAYIVLGLFVLTTIAYILGSILDHRVVSPLAQRQFNKGVESGLRNVAFGTDIVGERPHRTAASPRELGTRWQPLPQEPHDALASFVRQYLSDMMEKMRARLGMSASSSESFELTSMFDALSWHELIHTSYFDVEEVRWLIAEAYASRDDFETTGAFGDDKRSKAQSWLEAMRGK